MSDINNIKANLNLKMWWIDWWRNDEKHYFCAVIEINDDQYQYIERELSKT